MMIRGRLLDLGLTQTHPTTLLRPAQPSSAVALRSLVARWSITHMLASETDFLTTLRT